MLLRNTNSKPCIMKKGDDIYNAQCCCNCLNRYVLFSWKTPYGYVCRLNFSDSPDIMITKLTEESHSFCECYEPVTEQ